VSGDLPAPRSSKALHLAGWEAESVSHVLDVREERDDSAFIREHSTIVPHWLGIDDHWSAVSDHWFESVAFIGESVLRDESARLLVHCHMGVNRGPSAAFALLLSRGWEATEALAAIRAARPFAGILYGPEAAEWHARRGGADESGVFAAREQVVTWLEENPIDLPWVIRSIGWRTA
jgi:hypothetical protein